MMKLKLWLASILFAGMVVVTAKGHPLDISNASKDRDAYTELWEQATPEEVQAWLRTNPEVNAPSASFDRTALMYAVSYNPHLEVIKLLLEAGADVNAHNRDGQTVLMYAAGSTNNLEIITTLLKAGADINARDNEGFTALIDAAQWRENPGIIITLLQAGADVKVRDNYDRRAIDYAQNNPALQNTDALQQLRDASTAE